jgi:hypothetical protein
MTAEAAELVGILQRHDDLAELALGGGHPRYGVEAHVGDLLAFVPAGPRCADTVRPARGERPRRDAGG